ncbi:MAG: hypothetical protein AB8B66_05865 [Rickettsiaceae bacterium]
MKTTYTFIRDLMSLLKRGNWQQDLYNRNNQINQELEILPEQCNQEIRRMKIRWKELGSKGRTIPSQEKQAELCLKKLARYTELEQKLLQEQLDIEYCLNVNQYKIGIGVFQNAQDASMLLANIHLLYSKEFSADFNPNTLSAVKSMLKANFDKLLYNVNYNYRFAPIIFAGFYKNFFKSFYASFC